MVKGLSISSYSTEGSVARFSIGQTKGKPVSIVGSVPKPGQSLFVGKVMLEFGPESWSNGLAIREWSRWMHPR
jgi:hypothetical protein